MLEREVVEATGEPEASGRAGKLERRLSALVSGEQLQAMDALALREQVEELQQSLVESEGENEALLQRLEEAPAAGARRVAGRASVAGTAPMSRAAAAVRRQSVPVVLAGELEAMGAEALREKVEELQESVAASEGLGAMLEREVVEATGEPEASGRAGKLERRLSALVSGEQLQAMDALALREQVEELQQSLVESEGENEALLRRLEEAPAAGARRVAGRASVAGTAPMSRAAAAVRRQSVPVVLAGELEAMGAEALREKVEELQESVAASEGLGAMLEREVVEATGEPEASGRAGKLERRLSALVSGEQLQAMDALALREQVEELQQSLVESEGENEALLQRLEEAPAAGARRVAGRASVAGTAPMSRAAAAVRRQSVPVVLAGELEAMGAEALREKVEELQESVAASEGLGAMLEREVVEATGEPEASGRAGKLERRLSALVSGEQLQAMDALALREQVEELQQSLVESEGENEALLRRLEEAPAVGARRVAGRASVAGTAPMSRAAAAAVRRQSVPVVLAGELEAMDAEALREKVEELQESVAASEGLGAMLEREVAEATGELEASGRAGKVKRRLSAMVSPDELQAADALALREQVEELQQSLVESEGENEALLRRLEEAPAAGARRVAGRASGTPMSRAAAKAVRRQSVPVVLAGELNAMDEAALREKVEELQESVAASEGLGAMLEREVAEATGEPEASGRAGKVKRRLSAMVSPDELQAADALALREQVEELQQSLVESEGDNEALLQRLEEAPAAGARRVAGRASGTPMSRAAAKAVRRQSVPVVLAGKLNVMDAEALRAKVEELQESVAASEGLGAMLEREVAEATGEPEASGRAGKVKRQLSAMVSPDELQAADALALREQVEELQQSLVESEGENEALLRRLEEAPAA
ncbi:hypothetical protein CYMTET_15279, partial [Cymbomonas tetramitiformis]